jgi:hypothetical protein
VKSGCALLFHVVYCSGNNRRTIDVLENIRIQQEQYPINETSVDMLLDQYRSLNEIHGIIPGEDVQVEEFYKWGHRDILVRSYTDYISLMDHAPLVKD